jgi:C-terminal processing protease CtpA/Prc
VTPLTYDERIAPIKQRQDERKGGDEALFEWKDMSDGSGYLKMPTWALYDSKWNWKQWLNTHLDEAVNQNAPSLILDLRGNEGGDDVGNEILPYLIDAPINLSSMRRLVRYRSVPKELNAYLDTWDNSFRDWGSAAKDLAEPWPTAPAGVKYLKLTRSDDDPSGDVIKPSGKRFKGSVFVLIDATNRSATFQFAQAIQKHKLGTLVGEPTGGSQRGINGGAFFFLRLPHSGIEMDLPLIGTFPATSAPDAGVAPDILVRTTAADVATGRDAGLLAVMRALRK